MDLHYVLLCLCWGPSRDHWREDVARRSAGMSPDLANPGQCEDKVWPQSIERRKADAIVFSGRQGSEYTVSDVFKMGKFPQLIFGWDHSGVFIPEPWTCPIGDKGPLLCTCREEGRDRLFYALLVLSIVLPREFWKKV